MIPIVADIPSLIPGLGFREYAEAIADALLGGEPPQFTIGLYGPWGSGKSSLLNAISNILRENKDKVITVQFDAWRYERTDHIIIPVLYAIYDQIKRQSDKRLADDFKRALKSVLLSLDFSVEKLGIKISAKDIRDNWESQGLPALDEAFSKPFAEMSRIPEALKGRRIAVLIDDLDRCSPEKVVSVLESINLVMDIPGFIFVLALDYDVLIQAITTKYPHVSGDAFIQKMVQLPFRVPPLNLKGTNFLFELVPNWPQLSQHLPPDFTSYAYDIVSLALEANPRQIKRLINSYLLLYRVAKSRGLEINFELMAAMIGIQLRWPAQHRGLLDAIVDDNEKPLSILLSEEEEPELKRYAERFFKKNYSATDVHRVLQLTAVVAADESATLLIPANELRESRRAEFLIEIGNKGFKQSPLSERLFYNPELPGCRFVVTKHVARFEKRKGNDWRLWESYLLTKETDLALKVIDNPNKHFSNRR